ncbi:MAG: glycosyltransferase family 2 protein [Hyphomonadaceae bacterium]|nr:glycosyltransferase family 2 protein [Hyphomonadaceae bacterium]
MPMADLAHDLAGGGRSDLQGSPLRDLSVVIPAFNEEGAVRATVESVRRALDPLGLAYDIIVVNDGSTDATLAQARASGATVIDQPVNLGYGAALKAGIRAGQSDFVAILDADGTYPPDALPRMLEIARHADMVVGDRGAAMNNVPMIRRPAKWVLNSLADFLADRHIPDLNSGLRVFRRSELTPFLRLLPDGFSFTTTITLCMICSNLRVHYMPIAYGRRVGQSKIRAKHFFTFILLLLRIVMLFQPLRIFLPLGAILFALGFVKLLYDLTLLNVSETAIFGFLAALIIWSLGLIADMIARLHLRP